MHTTDPPSTPRHLGRIPFRRISGRWIAFLCLFATVTLFWLAAPLSYHLPLPHGLGPGPTDPEPPSRPGTGQDATIWDERKDEVRRAYLHALVGYKQHAFPADELLALSGGKSNKFNGWSVTLLDSMDTMWIMGLYDEFADAVEVVAGQNFTTGQGYAPFFETVIRYLGGLLSAYALSGEPILLARADDLGTLLLPVFAATSSGLPAYSVNTDSGSTAGGWMGNIVLFSEATSCQPEFKYLAKLTGRKDYYAAVDNIMNRMYDANVEDGLFPLTWSQNGRPLDEHFSVGASADSGYEYLLKQYLLSNDTKALTQYLKSMDGIINKLLHVTPNRHLLYVASTNRGVVSHNLEHLACFLPGVLALGAHAIPPSLLDKKTRERHQWAAEGLAYTCYTSYVDQRSGLGPDGLRMKPGRRWVEVLEEWEKEGRGGSGPPGYVEREGRGADGDGLDYELASAVYLLRPETVESLYVLWKTTGDAKWRERGYEIFTAIERNAKTAFGYASVDQVDREVVRKIDDMPSFFLAETLKYLYLLFEDGDPYPFSKWVFNTEAHPLPVFEWTEWEKNTYNITG
ncbi:glycoside hydrolase [Lyophyllum atratum]|nr:glycoside hydrolase [Lyophyllum atratum]